MIDHEELAEQVITAKVEFRRVWRALRRFKEFLDWMGYQDGDPLTDPHPACIIGDFIMFLQRREYSPGVITDSAKSIMRALNFFRGDRRVPEGDVASFLKIFAPSPAAKRKHNTIWDITIVLRWAEREKDSPNKEVQQRRTLLLLMIFCAFRPVELWRITRDRIDTAGKRMTIQVQTKTSKGQFVPVTVPEPTNKGTCPRSALESWLRVVEHAHPGEQTVWYKASAKGDVPATSAFVRDELAAILRECEIPKHFTAYTIRHATVSYLLTHTDVNEEMLTAYGRWAPGSTAVRHYGISTQEPAEWVADAFAPREGEDRGGEMDIEDEPSEESSPQLDPFSETDDLMSAGAMDIEPPPPPEETPTTFTPIRRMETRQSTTAGEGAGRTPRTARKRPVTRRKK